MEWNGLRLFMKTGIRAVMGYERKKDGLEQHQIKTNLIQNDENICNQD
jgi:hypothetical protein